MVDTFGHSVLDEFGQQGLTRSTFRYFVPSYILSTATLATGSPRYVSSGIGYSVRLASEVHDTYCVFRNSVLGHWPITVHDTCCVFRHWVLGHWPIMVHDTDCVFRHWVFGHWPITVHDTYCVQAFGTRTLANHGARYILCVQAFGTRQHWSATVQDITRHK